MYNNYVNMQSVKSEEMIKLFWQKLLAQTSQLGVEESALPWKCKAPKRIEAGSSEGVSPAPPENHYKMTYFEVLDTVIACVKSRFNQRGFQMCQT